MSGPDMGASSIFSRDLGPVGATLRKPRPEPEDPDKVAKREERERASYLKQQPLVSVAAFELDERLYGGRPSTVGRIADLTLADAAAVLERHGASVVPEANGALRFAWPLRSSGINGEHNHVRRELVAAIRVLLAAQPTVHECLTKKRALPPARPGVGGGVVA